MDIFLFIIERNILPVFTIVLLGLLLGKTFELNVFTLSKLNFYLFMPSFIFVYLYETDLGLNILRILLFCTIYLLVNTALAQGLARVRGYEPGKTNALKNALLFQNTGNIGLSLVTLVFSGGPFLIDGKTPYLNDALATLIVVLVFTNVTTNTLGFYFAGRGSMTVAGTLRLIFSMPSIYAIPLALVLKNLDYDMHTNLLWPSLLYLKNGLIPVALLTLGVQLAQTRLGLSDGDVHLTVLTRLLGGPLLALGFIYGFGFRGVVAQTLLIACSVPTAVNTALIAVECKNHPEFATQIVVWSTIFSALTLSLVVYGARILFPI